MAKISRTAARACLAEIQRIADAARAGYRSGRDSDSELAHEVLMRLIGSLEASVPSEEWNKVDVFRRGSSPQSTPREGRLAR
jgi:hypothetical protein